MSQQCLGRRPPHPGMDRSRHRESHRVSLPRLRGQLRQVLGPADLVPREHPCIRPNPVGEPPGGRVGLHQGLVQVLDEGPVLDHQGPVQLALVSAQVRVDGVVEEVLPQQLDAAVGAASLVVPDLRQRHVEQARDVRHREHARLDELGVPGVDEGRLELETLVEQQHRHQFRRKGLWRADMDTEPTRPQGVGSARGSEVRGCACGPWIGSRIRPLAGACQRGDAAVAATTRAAAGEGRIMGDRARHVSCTSGVAR